MLEGGDQRRIYVDTQLGSPLPNESRVLVAYDPSILVHSGENSTFPRGGTQNEVHEQKGDYNFIIHKLQKLQDDVHEAEQKVKHHEENIRYLRNLKNNLECSIRNIKDVSLFTSENNDTVYLNSEETIQQILEYRETVQQILKYENSAAALLCRLKRQPEDQVSHYSFTKDVIGVVATLGRVNDDKLSRLLSGYLGLETMLSVVCKTYEGVKALEAYNSDGSINKKVGLHAIAPLDRHFQVICLEHLRPYVGEVMDNDPQRKLNLMEPKLLSGETPPGFLGFAVNLVNFNFTSSHCMSKTGYSLRETLFYHLFDTMQIYRRREDMLNARTCITSGAMSLDGGFIQSPGIFSLGLQRGDIDVKFPGGSESFILPDNYIKIKEKIKETKCQKEQTQQTLEREKSLLNHAKINCQKKKEKFIQFMADSSPYTTKMGHVSTPR